MVMLVLVLFALVAHYSNRDEVKNEVKDERVYRDMRIWRVLLFESLFVPVFQ